MRITSNNLKKRLVKDGIKEDRCERCGLTNWLDKPIALALHHINENHFDNHLENLQILCPNCHIQVHAELRPLKIKIRWQIKKKTYCTCGRLTNKSASGKCRQCWNNSKNRKVVERPRTKLLLEELQTSSFLAVGKKYGVSDNAIRKWLKTAGIDPKVVRRGENVETMA